MKITKTKVLPRWIINLFFIIGLSSAVLFRIMIFFKATNYDLSRVIWYCAVFGYLLFFGYRFFIAYKRRLVIRENDLVERLNKSNIEDEYKNEINYILNSIIKSKEIINYLFIFVISIIAIVLDLIIN